MLSVSFQLATPACPWNSRPQSLRNASSVNEATNASVSARLVASSIRPIAGSRSLIHDRAMIDTVPDSRTCSYLGPAGTFTEAALSARAPRRPDRRADLGQQRGRSARRRGRGPQHRGDDRDRELDRGRRERRPGMRWPPSRTCASSASTWCPSTSCSWPGRNDACGCADGECASGRLRPDHSWLDKHLPGHAHLQSASNVAARRSRSSSRMRRMRPSRSPTITDHHRLDVLATSIGDNPNAVTRFVLVSRGAHDARPHGLRQDERDRGAARQRRRPPARDARAVRDPRREPEPHRIPPDRGRARPLPVHHGSRRPHRGRARSPTRCSASKRFSPKVIFLGSYPRADRKVITVSAAVRRRRLHRGARPAARASSPAAPNPPTHPLLRQFCCGEEARRRQNWRTHGAPRKRPDAPAQLRRIAEVVPTHLEHRSQPSAPSLGPPGHPALHCFAVRW